VSQRDVGPLPALRRFADAIGPDGRARLLRLLEASDEDRAAAIGRLHLRDDGALLEELLIGLEEKEWARQAVIEALVKGQDNAAP
jgi:hypothetical protein